MGQVTIGLGIVALTMIASGVYLFAPFNVSLGALLEMSGSVLAVAVVGLTDGL